MKIGRYEVRADSWPWQGFGWFPHRSGKSPSKAPLNPSGARFGGGWRYQLGISIGARSVMVDLLFGSIRITRIDHR